MSFLIFKRLYIELKKGELGPIDMKKTIIHIIAIFPNVSIHGVIYTY